MIRVALVPVVLMLLFGMLSVSRAEDDPQPSPGYLRQAEDFGLLAEGGDPVAQTQLARLYERGLGVPQSYRRAISLYRKAARNGHEPARRRLRSLGVSVLPPEPEPEPREEIVESDTGPGDAVRITVNTAGSWRSSPDLRSHDIIVNARPFAKRGRHKRRPRGSRHALSAIVHDRSKSVSGRVAQGSLSSARISRPSRSR